MNSPQGGGQKMDSHEHYFISEFADLIGETPSVLRRWEKEGVLIPSHRDEKGHRTRKS